LIKVVLEDIALNINKIRSLLPPAVKIVAVSKTRSIEDIMEAYTAGQRIFGENRVQELLSKKDSLPQDIQWHLIGHLQTNKVKFIIPFVRLIHSVDSFKLLLAINNEAEKMSRIVDCLLQFHIAREESKFGFSMEEVIAMLESASFKSMKNVSLCGIMGMATFTDNTEIVRDEFRYLKNCFDILKLDYFKLSEKFTEVSMGMSGDYNLAVEEGSTMVRIGSLIFGERQQIR
jgi:PLP dependent protein